MYRTVGIHLLWKSCDVRPVSMASWNRGFCSPLFCSVVRVGNKVDTSSPTSPLYTAHIKSRITTHAQKPDFVFRRNGRVHLNRRGASVQSTTGSRGVRISGSNAGYAMFRGSVKSTGYPLHLPVSPSLPLPCVTVYHHISTGVHYWY